MKIVVIRHSIRNRGGDRLILDYLHDLIQKGHEVVYWTNEIKTDFLIEQRIQIKKIPYKGVLGTILFSLLTKFSADVVLVDVVALSVFVVLRNRGKVIYLAQDDDRSYYSSIILKTLTHGFYRFSLTLMKTPMICVSQYLADRLAVYSSRKVVVVPNGIDAKIFFHEKKSKHSIQKTTPYAIVLYARDDYRKGFDVGIKAIEELARIRGVMDWELWLIGDAKRNINTTGLKITRWGFLKDVELRSVLSGADVYLSSSRHEGFGLMQLEAMACGCVMVTTEAFALAKNDFNGLVSKVEDWKSLGQDLNRVLNDRLLFARLRSNGVQLVDQHQLEVSCRKFEQALNQLLV